MANIKQNEANHSFFGTIRFQQNITAALDEHEKVRKMSSNRQMRQKRSQYFSVFTRVHIINKVGTKKLNPAAPHFKFSS